MRHRKSEKKGKERSLATAAFDGFWAVTRWLGIATFTYSVTWAIASRVVGLDE